MKGKKLNKLIALAVVLGGVTLAPMAEAGGADVSNTTTGSAATTFGYNNKSTNNYSVALGASNSSSGQASVALGQDNTASANFSVSLGYSNTASTLGAVAIGYQNKAITNNIAVAIGFGNTATGAYAVAMGGGNTANGKDSVAMGNTNIANGLGSVAMGNASKAWTEGSVVFGQSYAGGDSSAAVDGAVYAFAAGYQNTASGAYSVAMGLYNTASSYAGVAIGAQNTASGVASVALGARNTAGGNESVAMGYYVYAGAYGAVALGVGENDGSGKASTSYGAHGDYSFVTGYQSTAYGKGSVALGNSTAGTSANNAEDTYAFAVGKSTASGQYSVAMGNGAVATPDNSFAFGGTVNTGATSGVALGYGSSVAENATNSVALGNGSVASGANEVSVGSGTDGDAYKTRKITNVTSAGTLSDDNTSAATGADVFNATTMGAAAGNIYAANADVVTAVKSIDTKIGALSGTATYNYIAAADTVSENLGALDTQTKTNADNITTMQGYFDANGVANKAAQDANGNVIASTYATKNEVSSTYATKTDMSSTYVTKTDFNTLSGTVTGYGTYITAGGLNANSQVITNVANGTADSHAVNYGQLKGAYTNATYSGNTLTLTKMDGTTTVINGIGGSTGDTFFEADGSNVKLKTASKITNVTGGNIASGSKEVVNGGQLYTTNQNVTANTNKITAIQGYVKSTGLDANNKVVANVADGYASNDAANLGQVQNYSTVTVGGTNVNTGNGIIIKGGKNVSITTSGNEITINTTSGGGGSGTGGTSSTVVGNGNEAKKAGSTAMGYQNIVSGTNSTAVGYKNVVSGSNSGAFGDPNTVSGSGSYAVGNDNTIEGNNNFVLGNNVNVGANITNSVVLGNNSTVRESNVVSVGSESNRRRIVNVADGRIGAGSTDAVTGSQLYETNTRVEKSGATAAALASLHPQMMRKGESQVMAGMGRYQGRTGAAVGLAWQPHSRVMLSGGFADASGERMFNVGASYKFGQHSYTEEELAELYSGTGTPLNMAEMNSDLKSYLNKVNTTWKTTDDKVNKLNQAMFNKDAEISKLMAINKVMRYDNEHMLAANAAMRNENAMMKAKLEKLEAMVQALMMAQKK